MRAHCLETDTGRHKAKQCQRSALGTARLARAALALTTLVLLAPTPGP